jgi:putative transposase
VERSSYRYEPRPDRNAALREAMVKLARQKPRYGYRRLHAVLERRGYAVNVKRVYRLYLEEGLSVRRKKRKRLVRDRAVEPRLTGPNQEWAMDFVVDGLATGRMVRILSVVDAYTRECVALEADFSLGSGRVTRVLERAIAERGRPENLRSDTSWFRTLNDVRNTLANWRREYNEDRPHSSLDYRTPDQFRRSIGYANVESKERFPHSHSRDDGDENKISKQNQNRETPVISG